jgi:hypothetical protein
MNDDWRNDPATEKQKEKLRFFGCTWDEGITKGQASNAIEECVKNFPQLEFMYQNRPATEQQRALLRGFGKKPRASMTYVRARDLIKECEETDWMREVEHYARVYVIDVSDWAEFYPGLTDRRVQQAAKVLDEMRPGWRDESNHRDIVIAKVGELNPQLAARWSRSKISTRSEQALPSASRNGIGGIFMGVIELLMCVVVAVVGGLLSSGKSRRRRRRF